MTVSFHEQTIVILAGRRILKKFIEDIFKKEKTPCSSLHFIFCTDEYLLEINKQFLQHEYYTDIITFNLAEPCMPVEGEAYISIERVQENASHLNSSLQDELLRVLFHGALHLCGYGDKSRAQIKEMRNKENNYLERFKTFHESPFP